MCTSEAMTLRRPGLYLRFCRGSQRIFFEWSRRQTPAVAEDATADPDPSCVTEITSLCAAGHGSAFPSLIFSTTIRKTLKVSNGLHWKRQVREEIGIRFQGVESEFRSG